MLHVEHMEIKKEDIEKIYLEKKEYFIKYRDMIQFYNERCGLTSIDIDSFEEKHFLDSLTLLPLIKKYINNEICFADIGTGAGFPSIPLLIINPEIKIDLIESNHRKAEFLIEVIKIFNFNNVNIICSNVKELKNQYDIVFFRAFSSLSYFFKLSKNILKNNCRIFAMKGKLSELNKEISIVKNEKIWKYITVFEIHKVVNFDWERNILELLWVKS
ncbi:MAG: 16S rRNA (guanine(527)-N(7))-methyltransferase RsmG [Exilispira sp.]